MPLLCLWSVGSCKLPECSTIGTFATTPFESLSVAGSLVQCPLQRVVKKKRMKLDERCVSRLSHRDRWTRWVCGSSRWSLDCFASQIRCVWERLISRRLWGGTGCCLDSATTFFRKTRRSKDKYVIEATATKGGTSPSHEGMQEMVELHPLVNCTLLWQHAQFVRAMKKSLLSSRLDCYYDIWKVWDFRLKRCQRF